MCSKKQKGVCENDNETRLKAEIFQRNFSRLAMKFSIPDGNQAFLSKNMVAKILHAFIDEITESNLDTEFFDTTIDVMEQESGINKKQYKTDFKDAKNSYVAIQNENTILPLASILISVIITFIRQDKSEAEMGAVLAYLSDKVYLSDSGKINKIKFNKLGNYIVQYIQKYLPNYGNSFKHLLTNAEKFETLEFKNVAKLIRKGEMDNLLPYDPFQSSYTISKYIKLTFSNILELKPERAIDHLKFLGSDLQWWAINNLLRLIGIKPVKKDE